MNRTRTAPDGTLLTLGSDGNWRDSRMRVWALNQNLEMAVVMHQAERKLRGRIIRQYIDGRWFDEHGNEYGLSDTELSMDIKIRLGVGPFSLNDDHPLNDGAIAHDYAYSSRAYQRSNPRSRADDRLEQQLLELSTNRFQRVTGFVLSRIARLFGGLFWENDDTRNK